MNSEGPRVLIPLDGSELSAWVLDRASALLRRPGAVVTLLGVVEAPPELAGDVAYRVDPRHAGFHAALAASRDRLAARGIFAHADVRFGDPAEAILREIREGGHDLVAMTTRGRAGVARNVLRGSTLPMLLFRPLLGSDDILSPAETREPDPFRRILVLLDGSALAEEILPPAVDLARLLDGEIRLFTAVSAERHRPAAEERLARVSAGLRHAEAASAALRMSIDVRLGAAAFEAMKAAREWGADLVALTTHGRGGAARAIHGSVAERILADAAVPLLVTRSRSLAKDVVPGREAGPIVHVT